MQIVILAGGLGTRLHPVTETVTKVMVPVHGKPFLEYQFAHLKKEGFRQFLILASYLHEQIQNYCEDGKKFGIDIQYSVEPSPLGTGGALKLAEPLLEEKFILINGDTFYPLHYENFLKKAADVHEGGIIAVYTNEEKVAANNVGVDQNHRIFRYSNQNPEGLNGVDGGISLYHKSVLKHLPPDRKCSLEHDLYPILIEQKSLQAHFTSERYYDMGTFDRLKIIHERLRS